jgi:Leucine-rich repeat (LRR) protein
LTLQGTKLEGSIPSELVKLSGLQHLLLLDMYGTSGTIPSGLKGLSKLVRLEVSNALFDESTFSNLVSNLPKSLETLVLSLINLKGTIPTEIGSLKNLSYAEFSENSMTGTMPTELGLLTNLEGLLLDGNGFQATIPTVISQLTKLLILTLGQSDLTGTVPSELGALTNLETLDLSGNNLSGSIPLTLCHVQNLYFTPCRKDQLLTVTSDCLVGAVCENRRHNFI